MEELQLALTTARVDQRNFGLWINNWQIGQTLNALVTSQLPTGELVLRVGGQQITATADIPIQQGAQLMLEVKQLQPVPTLRVLNPAANAAAPNVGGTLQLLSGSGGGVASSPLGEVAQALQTAQSAQAARGLPAPLLEALGVLLRQMSRPERLARPDGLAAAMRESGVFLESGLKATPTGQPPVADGDLKAGLFRALARVDAALSRIEALSMPASDAEALIAMKRDLEAGLARITLHQLNSQPVENTSSRQWQLEVPVQVAGEFHSLRIELQQERGGHQSQGDAPEDDHWGVRLQLSPPALGAIDVQLQMRGDELKLRLAARRDDVRQLIDSNLPTLARALESRGIALNAVSTAQMPAETSADASETVASTLDLQA